MHPYFFPALFGISAIYLGYRFLTPTNSINFQFREQTTEMNRSAVILGATGATGKYLVYHLLRNPQWSQVTTIGRSQLKMSDLEQMGTLKEEEKQKLTQHIHSLTEVPDDIYKNHDVAFCALGTTRSKAGSAEKFRFVDHGLIVRSASQAKENGVYQFSLVSAQGANENIWYHDAIHPLLYTHIKGKTENDVMGLKFGKTSIFRPGMLHRAGSDRWIEKIFAYLPNTHVSDLAKAMILDAQNNKSNEQNEPLILETGSLQNLAKQY